MIAALRATPDSRSRTTNVTLPAKPSSSVERRSVSKEKPNAAAKAPPQRLWLSSVIDVQPIGRKAPLSSSTLAVRA